MKKRRRLENGSKKSAYFLLAAFLIGLSLTFFSLRMDAKTEMIGIRSIVMLNVMFFSGVLVAFRSRYKR